MAAMRCGSTYVLKYWIIGATEQRIISNASNAAQPIHSGDVVLDTMTPIRMQQVTTIAACPSMM